MKTLQQTKLNTTEQIIMERLGKHGVLKNITLTYNERSVQEYGLCIQKHMKLFAGAEKFSSRREENFQSSVSVYDSTVWVYDSRKRYTK